MSDDNWGAAEPIRQVFHDLYQKLTDHFGGNAPTPQSDHDKAVQQMNDQANAQRTQDATKSFQKPMQLSPDQSVKIRKAAK